MKFYMREPEKALEGMSELTLEQVGAYNIIIDHLYARDGILPNNDVLLARMLSIRAPRWLRLKADLMAAGKIRITLDNLIDANGVQSCRNLASIRSVSARTAATKRWDQYRKSKQINGTAMPARNASYKENNTKNSSTSSNAGAEPVPNNSDQAAVVARHSSSGSPAAIASATAALEASLRKKGWI